MLVFNLACEEWDAEQITTEELKAIAWLTVPDFFLAEVVEFIDIVDGESNGQ